MSFLKVEPPITQAQVIRDLADMWKEESPFMWAGLAKNGVKEVGRASFAAEPLGGQTALVIRYGRTSTLNPAVTMKVTQYHIPLGIEKVLITLSYIDGDQGAMIAHDRLKKSILIR